MLKICSNCSFLEEEWKQSHCKNKKTPVAFIDNPKDFGCIFFEASEKLEACDLCDGEGLLYCYGRIQNVDNWIMCCKCNGEGYISTDKTK